MLNREFIKEYRGVRIFVWLQTHTEHIPEYIGTGHNFIKNPKWKPSTPLNRPIFHAVSFELSAIETTSFSKEKAISAYENQIDEIQSRAIWKKNNKYPRSNFMSSELFFVQGNN